MKVWLSWQSSTRVHNWVIPLTNYNIRTILEHACYLLVCLQSLSQTRQRSPCPLKHIIRNIIIHCWTFIWFLFIESLWMYSIDCLNMPKWFYYIVWMLHDILLCLCIFCFVSHVKYFVDIGIYRPWPTIVDKGLD